MQRIRFARIRSDAVIPQKAHITDAGYDLWVTHVIKINHDVTYFGTGIKMQLPVGYWAAIVGRSSLPGLGSGISLANCVGVIDNDYRGELIVAIRGVNWTTWGNNDEERAILTPGLAKLPAKVAQLVPVRGEVFDVEVIEPEDLSSTERNEGGFGSTDKK
jgi:dUTP pyrophosphatase